MAARHGWRGTILGIDLTSGDMQRSQKDEYYEEFIGGRLLASRLYWDEVPASAGPFDADNVLYIMAGPLAGTQATACSRWTISAKSPYLYPEQYSFGNCGGFFGAAMKQAGFDGITVRGAAPSLSYVLIENGAASLHDASGLKGLATGQTRDLLKERHGRGARIICIGPAGERLVHFATVNTDQGGAVGNGMGAVMGSKNLKAIVILGGGKVSVADPEKLKRVNKHIRHLRQGQNESLYLTDPMIQGIERIKTTPCYACPGGCARAIYRHVSGRQEVRKTCAAAFLYTGFDKQYHGEPTEIPFLCTSQCDQIGVCTGEVNNLLNWLHNCREQGVLTEEQTGLKLSTIGSLDFFQLFIGRIITREGFGDLLAQGTRRASIAQGPDAEALGLEQVSRSGYVNNAYGGRLFITNALFYATEPRNPIIQLHEFSFTLLKWALWYTTSGAMSSVDFDTVRKIAKRFWGSEKSVDLTTYDDKALAAVSIQNREHAKEAMVACDRYFPIYDTDKTDDGVGDPTLVPQLFEAVTGLPMSEQDYYRTGERSVNLQRAIICREGRQGRAEDQIGEFNFTQPVETEEGMFGMFNPDLEVPGGAGETVISRKGAVLNYEKFERMKDEYYALRGWDVETGLQTARKLETLGLGFVKDALREKGALK